MLPSSQKDVLIRRPAETLLVLAIVLVLVYVFTGMSGPTTFGFWMTIAILEAAAFVILGFAIIELDQDPRLHGRWRLFVPPLISVALGGSVVLWMIWLAAWLAVQASGIHLFDATFLFVAMFFYVDVSSLGMVVSLFLAVLRLNRSDRSRQDSAESP
jgi:hypothetical protein